MSAEGSSPAVEDEEPSRYGVASLDQMDDDEPSSSSSAAASASAAPAATAAANEGEETKTDAAARTVESYGLAVGVIEPPPDLKVIIDRTADFVRRVGVAFESEIMSRNAGKKQFQFLENPASPYHAYYKQRVKYGAEGPPKSERTPQQEAMAKLEEQKIKESEAAKAAAEAAEAAAKVPRVLTLSERMKAYIDSTHTADKQRVQEAEQQRKDALNAAANGHAVATPAPAAAASGTSGHIHPSRSAPAGSAAAANSSSAAASATSGSASFSFRVKHPDLYSAVDIDIIKLTALYISRAGTEFLSGLQRREQRNPYFDFLKPQHSLFVFFQTLVESYNRILIPPRTLKAELDKLVRHTSRKDLWADLLVEAAMKRKIDAALAAAKASEDADRAVLTNIDWRDFVVVETISFRDDEDEFLPAPRNTVEEMTAMLSAQVLEETTAGETEMETDMDMDTGAQPAAAPAAATPAPAPAAAAAPAVPVLTPEEEVARLIQNALAQEDDEKLEIRTDVGATAAAAPKRAAVFQKCIVCGDEIAIDDLAEHMRIELLDPRWKEQKQALLDKQRESSLASDSIVSHNLAKLARRVIGSEDKAQDQRAEIKARKQAAADAALLFGPNSHQAREAAARAGEILPPLPLKQVAPPPPPKAAPIGPAAQPPASAHMPAYRPPQPPQQQMQQPPKPAMPAATAAGGQQQAQPRPPMPPQPMPPAPANQPMPSAPGMMRGAPPPSTHFAGMPAYVPPPGAYGVAPVPYGSIPPFMGGAPGMMPPLVPGMAPPGMGMAMPMGMGMPPGMMQPQPPFNAAPPAAAAAAPAHMAPAMATDDLPANKKQRTDAAAAAPGVAAPAAAAAAAAASGGAKGKLLPESEFLAGRSPSVSLKVVVPTDPSAPFNFAGQTVALTLQLTDTVQTLKDRLSSSVNHMPANKMKLATCAGTHLNKDEATLAFYNVADGTTVNLGIKERGGKKK